MGRIAPNGRFGEFHDRNHKSYSISQLKRRLVGQLSKRLLVILENQMVISISMERQQQPPMEKTKAPLLIMCLFSL